MRTTKWLARRFDNAHDALRAAAGNYPLDYLIAVRGDRRHPSEYAPDEASLRVAIANAQLGSHPMDAIYLSLPSPSAAEIEAAKSICPDRSSI